MRDLPARDLGHVVRALRASKRIVHRERWFYLVDHGDEVDIGQVDPELRGLAAAWARGPEVLRARADLAQQEAERLRGRAAEIEAAAP